MVKSTKLQTNCCGQPVLCLCLAVTVICCSRGLYHTHCRWVMSDCRPTWEVHSLATATYVYMYSCRLVVEYETTPTDSIAFNNRLTVTPTRCIIHGALINNRHGGRKDMWLPINSCGIRVIFMYEILKENRY